MDEDRGSVTALVNAYVRAYHTQHASLKLFNDPIARNLFTDDEYAALGEQLSTALAFFNPELFASAPDTATKLALVMRDHNAPTPLGRSRYTEDALEAAVERGVRQYVIVGAGMDTLAFRRSESMQDLEVFELDHPSTQKVKRARLSTTKHGEPAHLHYLPLDFITQSLADALLASTFDRGVPTFINCSGLTYYMDRQRLDGMLRSLSTIVPAQSELVFDYLDPLAFSDNAPLRVQRMLQIVQRIGEPMKTTFDPTTLGSELANLGWRLEENLAPSDIEARYFANRTDGYHAFEHFHFARAVKPE